MRSIRSMAATTFIVALASACGDGGRGIGDPPVAIFTAPSCTAGTPCQFTDASTPVGGITSWSWNFGDGTALDPNQNPLHTFAAAGTPTVTLTVTNSDGSNSTQHTVTVAPGTPTNQPPVASFTAPACTANAPCTFTSTSTDADGNETITLTRWDFGGGVVLDGVEVTHTFAAAGTFNVILTVTDNLGATGTVTLPVTVSPPTATDCSTSGTFVNCILTVTQRATVRITLKDEDCELGGNQFRINDPARARQVIFFNGCSEIDGTQYVVDDATGAPIVFESGEQIVTQFRQGTADPGDPAVGFPAGRLQGGFPFWTISIDDGGNPTGPGEPDFGDLVLEIQATPAP
jgi:PKD repeat protein